MPLAPPRPCRTCQRLHCTQHLPKPWQRHEFNPPPPRIRGRALQQIRQDVYTQAEGKCARCGRPTTFKEGVVDHIVNLAAGGTDTADNRNWMCKPCHEVKRRAEAKREGLGDD